VRRYAKEEGGVWDRISSSRPQTPAKEPALPEEPAKQRGIIF
jgi:hypothetical protein